MYRVRINSSLRLLAFVVMSACSHAQKAVIYFFRHPQSTWNEIERSSSLPKEWKQALLNREKDVGLTMQGTQQLQQFMSRGMHQIFEDIERDHVHEMHIEEQHPQRVDVELHSSNLRRTMYAALAVKAHVDSQMGYDLTYRITPALKEISSTLDAQSMFVAPLVSNEHLHLLKTYLFFGVEEENMRFHAYWDNVQQMYQRESFQIAEYLNEHETQLAAWNKSETPAGVYVYGKYLYDSMTSRHVKVFLVSGHIMWFRKFMQVFGAQRNERFAMRWNNITAVKKPIAGNLEIIKISLQAVAGDLVVDDVATIWDPSTDHE